MVCGHKVRWHSNHVKAHARDATIIVGFTTTHNSGTQVLPLNHSTTATLGTEESGLCRGVETRVNVWTACQKTAIM